ncbi:hypothetical protein [Cellulomonas bogoriensis]|uniref:Uncharacterized protein n=1 Tax=Cellulomonas bogoriensis 69B4 = DSM 16987 TaxID=1386082 RepID=A0A0A0C2G5_9CELL|nr:hypothetical protein [Cellulomonas bogoriensis]KGM13569.1 hypothetical protein N869_13005 [Cellulomonas bogoriensis 69B4 = DSM 16987]
MTQDAAPPASLAAPHGVLSLADVAHLADVQRPVATVWRSRHGETGDPFPDPVVTSGGRPYFAAQDVVAWLERTGRGNNPHARADAALAVALDVLPERERTVVAQGLTALLCLKAVAGTDLLGGHRDDLLDLADAWDPDDRLLYGEMEALGDDLPRWAAHAEAVASAGFSPAAALERLVARHRRLRLQELDQTVLADAAVTLVGAVAAALAQGDRPFVDVTGAGVCILAAGTHLSEDAERSASLGGDPEHPMVRLGRRRLAAGSWDVSPPGPAIEDAFPSRAVVAVQLPCPSRPHLDDREVIETVERIALTMDEDHRAVVVGPASALTDRARTPEVANVRADVLRTGRVRAMVRLPAGLWPARSRQALGVWVLGPAQATVRAEDRWVALADLTGQRLDPGAVEDVVTDVVAALGDREAARRHAFRFARLVPASSVQAAGGDLVTVAPPARRPRRSPAELAVIIEELATAVTAPVPAVTLDVSQGEHGGVVTTTLGELVRTGAVRTVPGTTIDPDDIVPDGEVRVIGTDEIAGRRRVGERTLDRVSFSVAYPSGRYTEPGDVVFCSGPGAVVDDLGLAVVAQPARVLRVVADQAKGLTPHLLAHAIRSAPSRFAWRSWPVRLVPAGQTAAVDAALRTIVDLHHSLTARADALDDLTAALLDGVSTGGLTLNPIPDRDDLHHGQEG